MKKVMYKFYSGVGGSKYGILEWTQNIIMLPNWSLFFGWDELNP